jgi:hypothetical protein
MMRGCDVAFSGLITPALLTTFLCPHPTSTSTMNPSNEHGDEHGEAAHHNPLPPSWQTPPGYSVGTTPDGHHYLVPNFMIRATDLALETDHMRTSMNLEQAQGGVSVFCNRHMSVLLPVPVPVILCRPTQVPVRLSAIALIPPKADSITAVIHERFAS